MRRWGVFKHYAVSASIDNRYTELDIAKHGG